MLQVLPALAGAAAITSIVLLVVLWKFGDLSRRDALFMLAWFLLAVYCQYFGGSPAVSAVGLGLQTLLAIYLVVRFRLGR